MTLAVPPWRPWRALCMLGALSTPGCATLEPNARSEVAQQVAIAATPPTGVSAQTWADFRAVAATCDARARLATARAHASRSRARAGSGAAAIGGGVVILTGATTGVIAGVQSSNGNKDGSIQTSLIGGIVTGVLGLAASGLGAYGGIQANHSDAALSAALDLDHAVSRHAFPFLLSSTEGDQDQAVLRARAALATDCDRIARRLSAPHR